MSIAPSQREVKRGDLIAMTAHALRILVAPGQMTELRAIGVQQGRERPHTVNGFFDAEHLDKMAELAVDLSKSARGVYITMNPLRPDILARRANRVDCGEEGTGAKDADVIARR